MLTLDDDEREIHKLFVQFFVHRPTILWRVDQLLGKDIGRSRC
jgi:hypothetical protein